MECIQEEDTWGSDHFPLIFTMKFNNKGYRKLSNRISNYNTDWKKYKEDINNRNKDLEKEEFIRGSIEMKYKYINDIIREEAYKASGKNEKVKKRENSIKEKDNIDNKRKKK